MHNFFIRKDEPTIESYLSCMAYAIARMGVVRREKAAHGTVMIVTRLNLPLDCATGCECAGVPLPTRTVLLLIRLFLPILDFLFFKLFYLLFLFSYSYIRYFRAPNNRLYLIYPGTVPLLRHRRSS